MSKHLVWIDLEMTGLDLERHTICEIATIITDNRLNILAEGPELVIGLDEETLGRMDPWCVEHHGKSGLTERIRKSTTTMEEAEKKTLAFIKQYVGPKGAPLCGNSVWQDRRFLETYMPTIDDYLHYRIVDVSSIKELVYRWFPAEYRAPNKSNKHRALEDIRESIEELQYYRANVFSEEGREKA